MLDFLELEETVGRAWHRLIGNTRSWPHYPDHAVKLAEACLREDALSPDPALRLAAADAALHLGGPQRRC